MKVKKQTGIIHKLLVLLIFFFLIQVTLRAQDIEYAKSIVKELCSDQLKGRGYVEGGEGLAAEFISGEFEKSGLSKFGKSYKQEFTTPVNTFPSAFELTVGGVTLKPGEDFLIDPGAPGCNGNFKVTSLSANEMLDDSQWTAKVKSSSDKFILVDTYKKEDFSKDQLKKILDIISFLQYGKDNPTKGTIILSADKLTWSTSSVLFSKPSFIVKASSVNTPVEDIEVNVVNKFIKKYTAQNLIGYLKGERDDSVLVFTAHYDHLGMMGSKTRFPGANDNASGIAFLLSLAKHYHTTKPKFTIVFIAFGGEEIGLEGSKYYTEHPVFPLSKIKFLINFDMAGTGDDGVQVVNGKIYKQKFDLMTKINAEQNLLAQIKIRGEACNSDHCLFYSKGVPCFFIYTLGGIQAYHDIYDKAETLPFTDFEDYFKLMIQFIDDF